MADRVKEVAVEEAERLRNLTADAARSAAYLYPIRVCQPTGWFLCVRELVLTARQPGNRILPIS